MADAPMTASPPKDGAKRNFFTILIGWKTPLGKRPRPAPDTFDYTAHPFSSADELLALPPLQKVAAEPNFTGLYVDSHRQGLFALYSDGHFMQLGAAKSPIVGLPLIDELIAKTKAPAQAPNPSAPPQPATAG